MPELLFGNKQPDKQLVIAANLSSALEAVSPVPDPPTRLATEPLRPLLALFLPCFIVRGLCPGKGVLQQAVLPGSLGCGIWLE